MSQAKGESDLVNFLDRIGYDIGEHTVQNLEMYDQKSFDFMPDLAMFVASYSVKKTFTRQTRAPKFIKDSICFYFKNVVKMTETISATHTKKTPDDKPFVRVFPSTLTRKSIFKKNSQVQIVSIFISAEYLKSFLKEDTDTFRFLFDNSNNFWIEEIMTDDIVHTINEIVNKEKPASLSSYHYKLKAIELLYFLFQSLAKREKSEHQKLTESDIKSIYKVRDQLASSLDKPDSIANLKQTAGMNELKMRKLFTQIFGMGIYDYYQHLRMKEAARLLREEKLSVSETGCRMGFENMSHFTRVFEKHIGKKPKKYSLEMI